LRVRARPKGACVRQRTDLQIATEDTPAMRQFSIPNVRLHERFLSPRKSLLAVGVMCALSAVALLLAGRPPAPIPAADADIPPQLHANPERGIAPQRK